MFADGTPQGRVSVQDPRQNICRIEAAFSRRQPPPTMLDVLADLG